MTRIRYLEDFGRHRAGEIEVVTDGFAKVLIGRGKVEPASDEGDAGESVGPIAAADPADNDAHGEELETHMRRQPERAVQRRVRPE